MEDPSAFLSSLKLECAPAVDIDCLGNVDGDDDDDVRYNFPTKNYN